MNHGDNNKKCAQQRDRVMPDGVTWFTDGRQQYKNTIGYAGDEQTHGMYALSRLRWA